MIAFFVLLLYLLWRAYRYPPGAVGASQPTAAIGLLDASPVPDRTRLRIFGGIVVGLYAIAVSGLMVLWYPRSKRSAFHWFDDRKEWNQIDKAGHIFGGYFQTIWSYELLRWCGLNNKQAAVIAAVIGTCVESSIEVMDGYSSKYGASYSDLGGNLTGALIAAAQYWAWEEQRILLKFSYDGTGNDYPKGELAERASELFGDTYFDRGLKDYNNITIWASINPSKFKEGILPPWLCGSIGYSTQNLYGGFENKWIDKEGNKHDRTDIPRLRVLNFSLDADLPKLSHGNKAELGIFKMLNIFKVPFPRLRHSWEGAKVINPNTNGWGREE